jgi:hypothetical protein
MMSLFESYQIQFSTNIWYSYASGKFKRTVLLLPLSPDGRDDVWMLEGFTKNIFIIDYFYYKILLPYYSGLEALCNLLKSTFQY